MVQLEQIDDLQYLGGTFAEIEGQFVRADYRKLLESVSDELEEEHAEYYAGQHAPGGEAWKPLSPVTIRRKGHAIILRETDAMRDSLIGRTSDSIRDVVSEPPQHFLSFGTSDEKAARHQDGIGVPQREHVGMTEEFCDKLAEQVADFTVQLLLP